MSISKKDLVAPRRGEVIPDDLYTDAVVFVDRHLRSNIRCFVHLKDAEQLDYCYPSGDEISDYEFDDLNADYYDRAIAFPPIEEIIDHAMEGVTGNYKAVAEMLESSEDDIWEYIYQVYTRATVDEQQEEYDDLVELLEDMFNYLSICITNTTFLKDNAALSYLKCTNAYIEEDKLYLTFQIYADKLFELQESEKDNYLEVVDEIRSLIGDSAIPTKRHLLRDGLIGGAD